MISFATLFSSSKGNSIFVSSPNTKILVDAGMSARHIEKALSDIGESMQNIEAVLITHEHQDHIKSAGILSRRYDIPIYATPKIWETYQGFGDISAKNRKEYTYGMTIGELSFDFFKTFHDAVQPVGLIITHEKSKLGICTDTGIVTAKMAGMLYNSTGLIFESNHDLKMLQASRYAPSLKARIAGERGHLSNEDAVEALKQIIGPETKEILLAHLSEENNDPDLALQISSEGLKDFGVHDKFRLRVAPPHHTSEIIIL